MHQKRVTRGQGRLQRSDISLPASPGRVYLGVHGHEYPNAPASYNNIGDVLAHQGTHDEALVQYQKCLDIETRVYGQDHPAVTNSYTNVAAVYHHQGKKLESKEMAKKTYDTNVKTLGSDHPTTTQLKTFYKL